MGKWERERGPTPLSGVKYIYTYIPIIFKRKFIQSNKGNYKVAIPKLPFPLSILDILK